MDAVSIETEEENKIIYDLIRNNDVPYIWTSGRVNYLKLIETTISHTISSRPAGV